MEANAAAARDQDDVRRRYIAYVAGGRHRLRRRSSECQHGGGRK